MTYTRRIGMGGGKDTLAGGDELCAERAKNKGQRELHPTLQSLLMQRYDNLLEVGFKHDNALHPHENIADPPKKRGRKNKAKPRIYSIACSISKQKPCVS